LYREIVEQYIARMDAEEGSRRRITVVSALTKLKQVCNHPSNYLKDKSYGDLWANRSGKVERLGELVSAILGNGESCLVFTQYAQMALMLKQYLSVEFPTAPVRIIHGGMNRKEREEALSRYGKTQGPQILVSIP